MMLKLPSLRSWQKIAPHSIESWLLSRKEADNQLAEAALRQLGEEKARSYLLLLLNNEQRQKDEWRWRFLAGSIATMIFGMLILVAILGMQYISLASTLTTLSYLVFSSLLGKTTHLQRRIVDRIINKPTLKDISLLLQAKNNLCCYDEVIVVLPRLLRQVTPETKKLISDAYWEEATERLHELAKRKQIAFIPPQWELAKGDLELCGNTRYEPALPALQALADREVSTIQEVELRDLARRHLAAWQSTPTPSTISIPERNILTAGRWYAL